MTDKESNQESSKEFNDNMSEDQKWEHLTRPEKLGEVLLKLGKISLQQLEELIKEQTSTEVPLGELILSKGLMTRHELLEALDLQHKTDQTIIDSLTEMIQQKSDDDK
ncbi:MAG: hypothetical protein KGS72_22835 [Cyanobacteria bacterium REEB67]|nr:hypothetical protein [Cyanobacteria bacterium REEB67]